MVEMKDIGNERHTCKLLLNEQMSGFRLWRPGDRTQAVGVSRTVIMESVGGMSSAMMTCRGGGAHGHLQSSVDEKPSEACGFESRGVEVIVKP